MSLGLLFKSKDSRALSGEGAGPGASLLFSGERLPRDTFQAMRLADSVLREAEIAAHELRARTAATLHAQTQDARAQGFAQGKAEGLAAVLGTLEVEHRMRQWLSEQLAEVVEQCVRSLLGELGEPALMRSRILHLLSLEAAQASGASRVTLHVHPAQAALIQSVVDELIQAPSEAPPSEPTHSAASQGSFAGLKVEMDPRRAVDSLLLETRTGFIESDLELTLQQTKDLLRQALAYAQTPPLGKSR